MGVLTSCKFSLTEPSGRLTHVHVVVPLVRANWSEGGGAGRNGVAQ